MSTSRASMSASGSPLVVVGVLGGFPPGVEMRPEASGETVCAAGVEPGVLYAFEKMSGGFSAGSGGGNCRDGFESMVRNVHVTECTLGCMHTESHAILMRRFQLIGNRLELTFKLSLMHGAIFRNKEPPRRISRIKHF